MDGSPFTYAAQASLPIFKSNGLVKLDSNGNPILISGVPNVITVEGRIAFTSEISNGRRVRPVSGCNDRISSESDPNFRAYASGGNLSAVGTLVSESGVESGIFAPFGSKDNRDTGSSFAAPQAAGVAALVWTANPTLSMSAVRQILLKTAGGLNSSSCPNEGDFHQPVDAYAAVLAADSPNFAGTLGTTATPGSTPVRLAILNVASAPNGSVVLEPDSKFTQADILAFLKQFQTQHGSKLDYSRYDLNGDGRTGEPVLIRDESKRTSIVTALGSERFDLNGDGVYGITKQTVEGVQVEFDETVVSDVGILIYYAYSPLYEGNEYERTMLLLPYLEYASEAKLTKAFLREIRVNLQGLTATITGDSVLTKIVYQMSANDTGNDWGTRFISGCGLERGIPLFSPDVNSAATSSNIPNADDVVAPTWWWAKETSNTPPPGQNARTRCSDFIAAVPSTGEMWINVTKFPPNESNREYQARLYLGKPDLTAGPSPDGTFTPGAMRTSTQRGVFGFVDTNGSGIFQAGLPSPNFRVNAIRFEGDFRYQFGRRN